MAFKCQELFDLFIPTTADVIESYHLLMAVSSLETLGVALLQWNIFAGKEVLTPMFALAIANVDQVYLHRVGYGI